MSCNFFNGFCEMLVYTPASHSRCWALDQQLKSGLSALGQAVAS